MNRRSEAGGIGYGQLALLAVLLVLLFVVRHYTERGRVIRYDRVLMCSACNHIWGGNLDTGAQFPVRCPKCSQQAGGFAYRCEKCQALLPFIPQPSAMPICPKCKSTDCARLEEIPSGTSP